MYKYILVFLVLLAVFTLTAKEVIEIPLISNVPVIDGIVTAGEWDEAVDWNDFYQTSPGDNTEPSERTEVYLAYDKENIYCLAKCYFADLARLRDNHCSRDQIYTSDRVYFFFDTFLSNDQAYYFGCNANGEQADGIVIDDIDPSIDFFFHSAGGITEEGYFLELSLPLESIKYKSGKNIDWGVFFKRHIADGPEEVCGFPVPRGGGNFYDNYGILRFAELPNNMNLKLIPSITGNYNKFSDNITGEESSDSELQPELNVFFEPNSNLTFTATINPDFNIIEADGLEIDVNSRYPRYFQEKRPFFIEQSNPFSTDLIIFNTRNIVNPFWGGKLSGSMGGLSVYGLVADDEDVYGTRFGYADTLKSDATFGFLSVNKKLRNGNSFVRAAATMRRFNDLENYLISLDANNRFNDEIDADFQLAASSNGVLNENGKTETKFGYGYSLDMDYYDGTWFLNLETNGITEDYTADLGYIYDKNSIFTKTRFEYQIHGETDKDFLRYLEIASSQHIKTMFDFSDIRAHYWELMCGAQFNNDFSVWSGLEMEMENYLGKNFYMYYPWISLTYEPIKQLKVNILAVDGEALYYGYPNGEIGDYYKYESTLNIRPVNFFELEFKQKYKEITEKFIARSYEAIAKLQFHRNFWFRAIVQITNLDLYADDEKHESFNVYPLFTYKPSSKTAIYLGATGSDRTKTNQISPVSEIKDEIDTTYFLKMSYTFDIM
jgi:hypothetical protein